MSRSLRVTCDMCGTVAAGPTPPGWSRLVRQGIPLGAYLDKRFESLDMDFCSNPECLLKFAQSQVEKESFA
jgi:hypothetical protein